MKKFLSAAVGALLATTAAQAHTVGIGYLDNGNGTVTMFAEHWHGNQSGPSTANAGLGITEAGNPEFRTPWVGVFNDVNEADSSFGASGLGTNALTGFQIDPGNHNNNPASYDDWLYTAPLVIGNGTYSFFTGPNCCIDTMTTPLTFTLTGITSVPPGTGPGSAPTIPLPAAGWMLIAGIGGLAALRRRNRAG